MAVLTRRVAAALAVVASASATTLLTGTAVAADAAAPCGTAADACIDLSGNQSWLMDGGAVTYGPVPITSGKPGYETPTGVFRVTWKDIDHRSREYDNAPMPYSVFFTNNGIAFHEGSLERQSHGCIHLSHEAARTYFDDLQPRDVVEVVE
ncbi:MAG: L,D-transpeptidase [Pseudonocardiaceae bacterium]